MKNKKSILILLTGLLSAGLFAEEGLVKVKEFSFSSIKTVAEDYHEGMDNYEKKDYPSAIAFDEKDSLYIFDSGSNYINVYDKNFVFVKKIEIDASVEAERMIVYDSGILIYDYSGNETSVLFYDAEGKLRWRMKDMSDSYISRCDSCLYDQEDKILFCISDENVTAYYNLTENEGSAKKESSEKIRILVKSKRYSFKNGNLYLDGTLYKKDSRTQTGKNPSKLFYIGEDKDGNCIYSNTDLGLVVSGRDGNTLYQKRFAVEEGKVVRFPAVNSKGDVYVLACIDEKQKCILYRVK